MGMFDKDKEIGTVITNFIALNTPFIVWGVRIKRDDYPTKFGPAPQTELEVSRISDPSDKYMVTTLAGAIGAKAREATAEDFPAVVMLAKVPVDTGEALVLQFLKPWGNQAQATGDTPETATAQF